jgi:hypothetical protein
MSIFFVAGWRSARSTAEWLRAQERQNPEVAIIFGTAARYRRAKIGSYHDDAHPDNSALHTGAVRPHSDFVESFFFISPRMGHRMQLFEVLHSFHAHALFVRLMMRSVFQ